MVITSKEVDNWPRESVLGIKGSSEEHQHLNKGKRGSDHYNKEESARGKAKHPGGKGFMDVEESMGFKERVRESVKTC